jgi:imidazolonepropionase-like amidohydrolase
MSRALLALLTTALLAATATAQVPPPDEGAGKQEKPQADPKKEPQDDPAKKPAESKGPKPLAITVKLAIPVAGKDVRNAVILVRGDRIEAIGAKVKVPKDAQRVSLTSAYALPGLVDPVTGVGAGGDLWERSAAFMPELRAADTLDPWHRQVAAMAKAGVTTFGLVPSARNVAGGFAAACSVLPREGEDEPAATLLRQRCGATLSLADAALSRSRFPASRMGATVALAQALRAGADPAAPMIAVNEIGRDAAFVRAALKAVLQSGSPLIHVDANPSVDAALGLAPQFKEGMILVFPTEAAKRARAIARAEGHVILRVPGTGDRDRELTTAARLHEAGVSVAFASDAPSGRPDRLLLGASLAHAHGLPRAAALAAVTLRGAEALQVDDQVGTLEPGKRADIVFLSADPLSGAAGVVAVMAGGKWVVKPSTKKRPTPSPSPPARRPPGRRR